MKTSHSATVCVAVQRGSVEPRTVHQPPRSDLRLLVQLLVRLPVCRLVRLLVQRPVWLMLRVMVPVLARRLR